MTNNLAWHDLDSDKYDLEQYSIQNLPEPPPSLYWEFDYVLFEIKLLPMEPG